VIQAQNYLVFQIPHNLDSICPARCDTVPVFMNTGQAINQARAVMRRQHKALSTEDTYLFWLRRYMAALPEMPKGLSSEQKIERFLSDLALHHGVSASSQNQAFNAILFFYKCVLARARVPHDRQYRRVAGPATGSSATRSDPQ
jgi:hypothetical protein